MDPMAHYSSTHSLLNARAHSIQHQKNVKIMVYAIFSGGTKNLTVEGELQTVTASLIHVEISYE